MQWNPRAHIAHTHLGVTRQTSAVESLGRPVARRVIATAHYIATKHVH